MNLSVHVSVDDRGARRFLRHLVMALDGQGVREVAGRAGVNIIQRHLRDLDRTRPNKLGGRRSHFFSHAAASTHYRPIAEGALVSVTQQGVAQRYYGGTIRPSGRISRATGKPITSLAIPARAAAYGKSPAEYDDLFVKPGRMGKTAMLARREGKALRVYFWLVKSVTQKPDPRVMPTEPAIRLHVLTAVDNYIDRQIARAAR